jgi:hypothetical protein
MQASWLSSLSGLSGAKISLGLPPSKIKPNIGQENEEEEELLLHGEGSGSRQPAVGPSMRTNSKHMKSSELGDVRTVSGFSSASTTAAAACLPALVATDAQHSANACLLH